MYLDISEGSKEKIVVFEGDNLEELTKITLVKDGSYIDLTGLTCDMAYTDVNSENYGDILENLTISNAEKGEIELSINSNLTKKDGVYDCEFRLSNSKGYVKYTAFFSLIVKENIFNKIGNKILSNNSFSKIKDILDRADKLKQDLSNAETTLSSLDSSNLAAKENIKNLQDNSNKATELNKALTANVSSVDSKNKVLQDSIKQAEDFSKTLQGGTDFVQMRKDIDTLENGLKNNQSLSYSGSNITCNDSLEGRTSGLKLYGKTLQNLIIDGNRKQTMISDGTGKSLKTANYKLSYILKTNTNYKIIYTINEIIGIDKFYLGGNNCYSDMRISNNLGVNVCDFTTKSTQGNSETISFYIFNDNTTTSKISISNIMLIETSTLQGLDLNSLDYFEGIKSVGEAEGNKISILSTGKNLFNIQESKKISDNSVKYNDGLIEFLQNDKRFYIGKNIFKKNTRYTISYENVSGLGKFTIEYTDGTTGASGGINPFTTEINKTVYAIRNTWIDDTKVIIKNVQLEEGTQATPYEPHKEYKKEIQLQQPFMGLESVQDTIEETDKGVEYTQNIGKRAYQTGDENLENVMTDKVNTYYVLDKPVKTILKGIEETDVDTYNIITYVKSLNTIPCVIDFSIATNYGSLFNQHSQEINRIWDTINNILVPTIAEVAERSVKTSMNLLNLK